MLALKNKFYGQDNDDNVNDAFRIFYDRSPQMSEVLLGLSKLFQSLYELNQPSSHAEKETPKSERPKSRHIKSRLPKNRATWDKLTMQMLRAVSRYMFEDCRGCGSISHIGTKFELVELFIRRGVTPAKVRRTFVELKKTACQKRKTSVRIK